MLGTCDVHLLGYGHLVSELDFVRTGYLVFSEFVSDLASRWSSVRVTCSAAAAVSASCLVCCLCDPAQ